VGVAAVEHTEAPSMLNAAAVQDDTDSAERKPLFSVIAHVEEKQKLKGN
jgi:hypothetical protein